MSKLISKEALSLFCWASWPGQVFLERESGQHSCHGSSLLAQSSQPREMWVKQEVLILCSLWCRYHEKLKNSILSKLPWNIQFSWKHLAEPLLPPWFFSSSTRGRRERWGRWVCSAILVGNCRPWSNQLEKMGQCSQSPNKNPVNTNSTNTWVLSYPSSQMLITGELCFWLTMKKH